MIKHKKQQTPEWEHQLSYNLLALCVRAELEAVMGPGDPIVWGVCYRVADADATEVHTYFLRWVQYVARNEH